MPWLVAHDRDVLGCNDAAPREFKYVRKQAIDLLLGVDPRDDDGEVGGQVQD